MDSIRLRRADASKYLQEKWGIARSPGTLAKIACCSSSGPRFQHAGRIPLYPVNELDLWAESILSPLKNSTSDSGARP